MNRQQGFSLIELMVVIAIIAILSALGIPTYQGYIQKAAMTDMLQTLLPYKTSVELCILGQNSTDGCDLATQGIPDTTSTRYISGVQVTQGAITLTGQQVLTGLSVVMTPVLDDSSGTIRWTRQCQATNANKLATACQDVFRFDDAAPSS